jgi:predicted nucleic acid-binding protein
MSDITLILDLHAAQVVISAVELYGRIHRDLDNGGQTAVQVAAALVGAVAVAQAAERTRVMPAKVAGRVPQGLGA